MKLKIRKGSTVKVITGSDKGKTGTVLDVDAKSMTIKVEGVRIQTKANKEKGLTKAEGYIAYSNVALIEAAKKKTSGKKASKSKSA